jgi:hypothetical protein
VKIHHTIQVPKNYDRLDELKSYIAEKYSSDESKIEGFHEFLFEEADINRPKWFRTVPPEGFAASIQDDAEPVRYFITNFGLMEYVLRFSDAP